MAIPGLPKIDIPSDIGDYGLTVAPFWPQLCALPARLYDAGLDFDALKHVWLTTNPLMMALAVALATAPVFFVVGEANRNYSQVDRCWGLLPVLFNVHYLLWAHMHGLPTLTLRAIVVLSYAWGLRLTYNYWRKGGFKVGSEDYRWAIVQEKLNSRFLFAIINAVFIATWQPVLLMLITAPSYIMTLYSTLPDQRLEIYDLTVLEAMVAALVIETVADNQQWDYQTAKHEFKRTGRVSARVKDRYSRQDLERGFNIHGLFSWSRHPNFAAEQAIWVLFHQWTLLKARVWFNWAGLGPLCYVLLFQASTTLTERISSSKYPEYKEYQRVVGMFVPKFTVETGDDAEIKRDLRKQR
ncbi:hypothetical protein KEM52_005305 [Ascosphaera acerosa]|nr:hypothetical protein KEM52_005305 [Ascosphaera acerosa]